MAKFRVKPTGNAKVDENLRDIETDLEVITKATGTERILTGVQVGTAATRIAHGFDGPLSGWTIEDKDGAAHVYRVHPANEEPRRFFYLIADATVTVSLRLVQRK